MTELEELLNKVVPVAMYRGVYVSKTKSGYKVLGVNCSTPEEVDSVINQSCENLSKSINK